MTIIWNLSCKKVGHILKASGDFINKTKSPNTLPDNAILVTADVVGLYPSIPHEAGLRALKEALDKQDKKMYSHRRFG